MNIKFLLLTFAFATLVSDVNSECDYFLECLGNVFRDFLNIDQNSTEIFADSNNSDVLDELLNIDSDQNVSINVFELTDLQKSLNRILTDVSSLVKDEIEIVPDVFRTVKNETEIYVKTFGLKNDTTSLTNNDNSSGYTEKFDHLIIESDNDESILNRTAVKAFDVTKPETVVSNVTLVKEIPILIKDVAKTEGQKDMHNKDIHLQPFQLDIIPKIILQGHGGIKDLAEKVNTNKYTEGIYIEPFHIDITPEFVSQNKENLKDFVRNTTKTLHNITLLHTPNITNFENKQESNREPNNVQTEAERVSITLPEIILLNSKDVTSDLDQTVVNTTNTTTVIYNVTKSFDIQIPKDYNFENIHDNEISKNDKEFENYDIQDHNATDSEYPEIDYIDIYKDTTNEYVEYKPTDIPNADVNKNEAKSDLDNAIDYSAVKKAVLRNADNANDTNIGTNIGEAFPWLATIFVKNGTSDQFDYVCDGAVISANVILTAGHCVSPADGAPPAESVLVILGKTSLQQTRDGETVHRVTQILLHTNFTDSANDLALLKLEEAAAFSASVQPARMEHEELGEIGEAFTTGWAFSGNLTAIHFDKEKTHNCKKTTHSENVFCATYDNDVATCPSYGGLYLASFNNQWTLQGIRTSDSTNRYFCIDKNVLYTSLHSYVQWIAEYVELNKV